MIRLLLDQGIPRRAVPRLQDRGFAARHVADIGLERASDLDILQAAHAEGECVVTLDADFHSRLPVVVYVPEGVEVHYRIWAAGSGVRGMEKG